MSCASAMASSWMKMWVLLSEQEELDSHQVYATGFQYPFDWLFQQTTDAVEDIANKVKAGKLPKSTVIEKPVSIFQQDHYRKVQLTPISNWKWKFQPTDTIYSVLKALLVPWTPSRERAPLPITDTSSRREVWLRWPLRPRFVLSFQRRIRSLRSIPDRKGSTFRSSSHSAELVLHTCILCIVHWFTR